MCLRWHCAGWIGVLVLMAWQAGAQEVPGAIGRISYGDAPAPGAAICTGVLVAPDLVLTAGHCLASVKDTPGTVRFAAGFDEGRSIALRHGAEVILSKAEVSKTRANDVALLRLDSPIAADLVAPLPLADPALALLLPQFSVIAYRRDAPDRAERQDDCVLRATSPGVLALSCAVVSGNSGAPALVWDGTGWQIVAVMVAAISVGAVHALAALVPPDLLAQIKVSAQP